MKTRIHVLFLAGLVAGCAGTAGVTPASVNAPVSKSQIAAVEVSTTTAINLANRCLSLNIGPCGVAASRATIIAAEHEASDAFDRLRTASASGQPAALAAANEALRQLAVLTPPIPAGK